MKIYITGIAGMLGYGIASSLKHRAEITGMDIVNVNIPEIRYCQASLLDYNSVEMHLKQEKPDVLIHTAALVNVDECEENPERAELFNSNVTAMLSDICEVQKIKMVYISTDAVFDGEEERLYTEDDKTNPINIYGKTKLKGEYFVLQHSDNLVLRTNIYGLNIQDKKSFGEWIYDSLKKDLTIKMFTDIYFSPILVNELAELIYLACEKNIAGLYHACGSGCISKYEFGMELKKIFNINSGEILKSASNCMHFKAPRSKHMGMDNKRLKNTLGVSISTPIESIYKFYHMIEMREKNECNYR